MSSYDEAAAQAIASLEEGNQGDQGDQETPESSEEQPQETEQPDSPEEGAPEASEKPAGQPPAQPPSDFDANAWQLKFRDKVITPKSKDELIRLAQQGFSYSQRMQQLKQQADQLKQQEQEVAQYRKLTKAFQENPKFREQIMAMYNQSLAQQGQPQSQGEGGQSQAQQQAAQLDPGVMQQIQELQSWKNQYEEQLADQNVKNEMEALKNKYQRDDWDTMGTNGLTLMKEILQHNYQNPRMSLEQAYRDLMFDKDRTAAKADGLKQAQQARKKQQKQGVVTGKSPAAPKKPSGKVDTSRSYDELAQQAINEFVKE